MRNLKLILLAACLPLAACGDGEEATQKAQPASGPRLILAETDTADWQDVSAEITTVDQAQVIARIPGNNPPRVVLTEDPPASGEAKLLPADELVPLIREMPNLAAAFFLRAPRNVILSDQRKRRSSTNHNRQGCSSLCSSEWQIQNHPYESSIK